MLTPPHITKEALAERFEKQTFNHYRAGTAIALKSVFDLNEIKGIDTHLADHMQLYRELMPQIDTFLLRTRYIVTKHTFLYCQLQLTGCFWLTNQVRFSIRFTTDIPSADRLRDMNDPLLISCPLKTNPPSFGQVVIRLLKAGAPKEAKHTQLLLNPPVLIFKHLVGCLERRH
jgi:hypothetical protein